MNASVGGSLGLNRRTYGVALFLKQYLLQDLRFRASLILFKIKLDAIGSRAPYLPGETTETSRYKFHAENTVDISFSILPGRSDICNICKD